MVYLKKIILVFFIVLNLSANMKENIVYVEDKNSHEISIKDEFLKGNSSLYTITLSTLNIREYDPIEYFKNYKMTNALAYKYGEEKKYAKVLLGVYKTGTQAQKAIEKLDKNLKVNKPYSSKISRHQRLFLEFNGQINTLKKANVLENKKLKKEVLFEDKYIFTSEDKEAKELKKEFLNKESKYYSIAIGTLNLDENTIENFMNYYNIKDKALAHIYGKNKNKVRVIYGLYKTKKEARDAIKNFNKELKQNKPFYMHMSKFQSFYKKSFNSLASNKIVELKETKKEKNEKTIKPILSNEIKILKSKKQERTIKKLQKQEKKEEIVKKHKKIKKQEKKKKIVKKEKQEKKVSKEVNDPNKNRYIKLSKLEDVYYVEENGEFNILNEVFLNDGSSFYTIDIGELNLKNSSLEKFFSKNNINNEALAYKYGDNKQFARIIYGAYETIEAAKDDISKLNITRKEDFRVSNIKNHQKLYKTYHRNIMPFRKVNKKSIEGKKNASYTFSYNVIYTQEENKKNLLKKEFFNRDTKKYTITLITFLKDEINIDKYFEIFSLSNNALAYPLGSENSYYRVIYGVYNSYDDAKNAIESLDEELRKNLPYVSKIKTNQIKFESYNGRVLEKELEQIQKIEFR